jgi:hypothetical protein
MAHYPMAIWEPTKSKNWGMGPMANPPFGMLLHITDGAVDKKTNQKVLGTMENMNAVFDARNISVHFAISKSGSVWQFVDTKQCAKALGGGYRDSKWISVENFALPGEVLTAAQIASVASLYAWFVLNTGMSMKIVDVTKSPAAFDSGKERGLGGHSMYRDPDRTQCPGKAILAQRKLIMELVASKVSKKGDPWD